MPVSVATVGRGRHRYYLDTVAAGWEDHRAPGLEPDGTWEGSGAGALGLGGAVSGGQLSAVMEGASPGTGEALRRAAVSVVALDLTFSAPKSVSVLFALSDGAVATAVLDAHTAAVRAVLSHVEVSVARAWRGSGERRQQLAVPGVVAASFLHRTSRAADPHLHTHLLVANLGRGEDGRWSAIDSRVLFASSPALSSLYFAHLRHELVRSLGVVWERRPDERGGRVDLAGMAPEVRWAFSRRRQQVESWLEERGRGGPRWSRAAALATREPKDPTTSFDALRPWWAARARAVGLGVEELASVVGRGPTRPGPPRRLDVLARHVLESALTAGAPGLSRPAVVKAWAEAITAGAPVPAVEALSDTLLRTPLVAEVTAARGLSRGQPSVPDEGDEGGGLSARPLGALRQERDAVASRLLSSMPPDPSRAMREAAAARAAALRRRHLSELEPLDDRLGELERQVSLRTSWAVCHGEELRDLAELNRAVEARERGVRLGLQVPERPAGMEAPALE